MSRCYKVYWLQFAVTDSTRAFVSHGSFFLGKCLGATEAVLKPLLRFVFGFCYVPISDTLNYTTLSKSAPLTLFVPYFYSRQLNADIGPLSNSTSILISKPN